MGAAEPDLTRCRGLEPTEREKALRICGVHRALVRSRGARECENGRPRLAWLEGLEDQLGESVAKRKREQRHRRSGGTP